MKLIYVASPYAGDDVEGGTTMKYGVIVATRPDSPWGRTVRWRCDRYGRPLAFDSEAEAREAAIAFNGQRCTFEPNYDNTVQPLEKEASQWNMELS